MIAPMMRSKLFVPASRPELFAKAAASPADALSFDLEDSVAPERKVEARASLAAYLAGAKHTQIAVVRINALGTEFCAADIAAIAPTPVDIVNLPMAEHPEQIIEVAKLLDRHEPAGRIGILVNIETPRALRRAAELAQSHPRVAGLQIGYADLFEPGGIDRLNRAALDYVRVEVRLAAAEAGLSAYDGAFFAVDRPEDCRCESLAARATGFAGKSCIHPSQVPIVNAAFSPTEVEIERARAIVAAWQKAADDGVGAILVDGQMVDAPFLPRARALVEWADRRSDREFPSQ